MNVPTVCEALHKSSKHAKKYANLASENYYDGKKSTAHANSLRKNALYSMKSSVLKQLYDADEHDPYTR